MSVCHDHGVPAGEDLPPRARTVLWIALALNAAMFAVEIGAGLAAKSVALQADALDFLGDAATYAISLFVLTRSVRWRAGAAVLKGFSLGALGTWVAVATVLSAVRQPLPDHAVMGGIGTLALAVNIAVAVMLFRMRGGDANLRSAWLCSRNDAIGNLAVLAAALGVFGTASAWPDLVVGAVMATLALSASVSILRQARGEWRAAATAGAPAE
ncbi:MAG: cation transporter [Alphaproteobacteria bacterium]|nr:cation transporter [Alphaproteobacteria bacterium]